MTTSLSALQEWVDSVAQLTNPQDIHWCDGSEAENARLIDQMKVSGDLIPLDQESYPDCYLHRSDPSDVARVEHLTFVCTSNEDDAGPNNHWMNPTDAHAKIDALFEGAMEGRTMYVIPYCMGPIESPYARLGVEITDSPYVVVNMRLMTRMGATSLARIENEGSFVKGLHSTGDLDPERRFIMHFPEEFIDQEHRLRLWRQCVCSARNATHCELRAGRHVPKAGWRSTCSLSASRVRRAKRTTLHAHSPPPAAKRTSQC